MKFVRCAALLSVAATCLVLPSVARADFVWDFGTVVTGDTPGGDAPWATLTCDDSVADTVTFTLTHNTESADGQFLTKLWLNLATIPGDLDFSSSDASVIGADWGEDAFNNAGFDFDVVVDFENSNSGDRILPGDSVSFTFTGTGLDCEDFNVFSANDPGLLAMLHIQGIAGDGEGSSKVTVVPEPASMAALGLGALGLLARRKKARR